MEFDDALRTIGPCGKYQLLAIVLRGFVNFQHTFTTMGTVFIAAVPQHWCHTPELGHLNLSDQALKNLTIPLVEHDDQFEYSSCSRFKHNYSAWMSTDVLGSAGLGRENVSVEACPSGWKYDSTQYTSSIVSQWDLVCDRAWMKAASSSVYMAGFMLGNIVASTISDIYGRRPVFIGCFLIAYALAIAIPFSPNYIAFCVLRFFAAACNIGYMTSGYVIVMEIVGPDQRAKAGVGSGVFWAMAMMIYAAFAYFIRDWFVLCLATSAIVSPMCVLVFFMEESPRWLHLHGHKLKAETILKKASRMNGKYLPDVPDIRAQTQQKKGYFWDLWRTRTMAFHSSVLCFIWFVCSGVYFGLSLNTSNIGGNDFVNFFIAAAIEIPCYFAGLLAVHLAGTRWPQCLSLILSGLPLLLIMVVPTELNWVKISLIMVGKFGATGAFCFAYVLSAEIYPTLVRNIGVGCGSFSARIGGIMAPLINELGAYNRFIPLIVFGVISIAGGLLALTLPETKGSRLPETLKDGERVRKSRRGWNFEDRTSTNDVAL